MEIEQFAIHTKRYFSCIVFLQLSIIEYLDETRPDPPLLPKDDPHKRALVLFIFCYLLNVF